TGRGLLLAWLILSPIFLTRLRPVAIGPTAQAKAYDVAKLLTRPRYRRIGVALEHHPADATALNHAVELARSHNAELILLHVVEGVGGQWFGKEAADRESLTAAAYIVQLA